MSRNATKNAKNSSKRAMKGSTQGAGTSDLSSKVVDFYATYQDPVNTNLKVFNSKQTSDHKDSFTNQLCFHHFFPDQKSEKPGCKYATKCNRIHNKTKAIALNLIDECDECGCVVKKFVPYPMDVKTKTNSQAPSQAINEFKPRCKPCYEKFKVTKDQLRYERENRPRVKCSVDLCDFLFPAYHNFEKNGDVCFACEDKPLRECPGVLGETCTFGKAMDDDNNIISIQALCRGKFCKGCFQIQQNDFQIKREDKAAKDKDHKKAEYEKKEKFPCEWGKNNGCTNLTTGYQCIDCHEFEDSHKPKNYFQSVEERLEEWVAEEEEDKKFE